MRQPRHDLRLAAVFVGAKQMRAALHQWRAAHGASGGLFDGRLARARFARAAGDFGDDLVRAADPHPRAHGHPLALDIAIVVQRGAAHGRARQLHRGNVRQRRELARTPHFPGDAFQRSHHFFRAELKATAQRGNFSV